MENSNYLNESSQKLQKNTSSYGAKQGDDVLKNIFVCIQNSEPGSFYDVQNKQDNDEVVAPMQDQLYLSNYKFEAEQEKDTSADNNNTQSKINYIPNFRIESECNINSVQDCDLGINTPLQLNKKRSSLQNFIRNQNINKTDYKKKEQNKSLENGKNTQNIDKSTSNYTTGIQNPQNLLDQLKQNNSSIQSEISQNDNKPKKQKHHQVQSLNNLNSSVKKNQSSGQRSKLRMQTDIKQQNINKNSDDFSVRQIYSQRQGFNENSVIGNKIKFMDQEDLISRRRIKNNNHNNSVKVTDLNKQNTKSLDKKARKQKYEGNLSYEWQQYGFMIIRSVKKFFQKLLPIIPSRKFKSLKQNHFQVLNDYACDYNYFKYSNSLQNEKPNCMQQYIYKTSGLLRRQCRIIYRPMEKIVEKCNILLLPDSGTKLLWDSFILILLIINIFYIPIKLAWKVTNNQQSDQENQTIQSQIWIIYLVDIVPQWGFLLDILMHFNTAYYQRGKLIKDRALIATHYLKNTFFWDFIVVTPFFINQYMLKYDYIDIILLLRQKKIRNIIKSYEELINLRDKNKGIYDLLKLILMILFVAHFTGCFMYMVGIMQIENGETDTWLQTGGSQQIYKRQWVDQYTSCLYFAVITMITVGYGDFTPITTFEKQCAIFITLISCGVFAYSVNNIGQIINNMTLRETKFTSKMSLLITYMRKRGIDKGLQFRVKNYFEYLYEENIEENEEAEQILDTLCKSLKQEVFYDIFYRELKTRKIFTFNFSEEFLGDLSTKMDEKWIGPEEIIHEKDIQMYEINIVIKGEIEFFVQTLKNHQHKNKTIKIIKQGEIFGEETFFTGGQTISGAKTNNVVLLMRIKKKDFLDVIKEYPLDYQRYCMIKHNILYDNDTTHVLNSKCLICNSYSHNFNKCYTLNYVPNKQRILNIHKKQDQPQVRKPTKTRADSKINSLKNFYYFKQHAYYFLVDECDAEEFDNLMLNFNLLEGITNNTTEKTYETKRTMSRNICQFDFSQKGSTMFNKQFSTILGPQGMDIKRQKSINSIFSIFSKKPEQNQSIRRTQTHIGPISEKGTSSSCNSNSSVPSEEESSFNDSQSQNDIQNKINKDEFIDNNVINVDNFNKIEGEIVQNQQEAKPQNILQSILQNFNIKTKNFNHNNYTNSKYNNNNSNNNIVLKNTTSNNNNSANSSPMAKQNTSKNNSIHNNQQSGNMFRQKNRQNSLENQELSRQTNKRLSKLNSLQQLQQNSFFNKKSSKTPDSQEAFSPLRKKKSLTKHKSSEISQQQDGGNLLKQMKISQEDKISNEQQNYVQGNHYNNLTNNTSHQFQQPTLFQNTSYNQNINNNVAQQTKSIIKKNLNIDNNVDLIPGIKYVQSQHESQKNNNNYQNSSPSYYDDIDQYGQDDILKEFKPDSSHYTENNSKKKKDKNQGYGQSKRSVRIAHQPSLDPTEQEIQEEDIFNKNYNRSGSKRQDQLINQFKRLDSQYQQQSQSKYAVPNKQLIQILKNLFPMAPVWEQYFFDQDEEAEKRRKKQLGVVNYASMDAVWNEIDHFDRLQIFQVFLVQNNIDVVLKKYMKIIDIRMEPLLKLKNSKFKKRYSTRQQNNQFISRHVTRNNKRVSTYAGGQNQEDSVGDLTYYLQSNQQTNRNQQSQNQLDKDI